MPLALSTGNWSRTCRLSASLERQPARRLCLHVLLYPRYQLTPWAGQLVCFHHGPREQLCKNSGYSPEAPSTKPVNYNFHLWLNALVQSYLRTKTPGTFYTESPLKYWKYPRNKHLSRTLKMPLDQLTDNRKDYGRHQWGKKVWDELNGNIYFNKHCWCDQKL